MNITRLTTWGRKLLPITVASLIRFRLFAILLFCAFLPACSYGPPQNLTAIENVRAQPDSHIIAVAVRYQRLRYPEGLSAFPDGGVPRVLDEEARIYLCDAGTFAVKRVASISPRPGMKSGCQPWVLGWAKGSLFFKLSGRAGTDVRDYQQLNTIVYRIDPDGGLSEGGEIPENISFQHNTGPLPQGIFVRVSKGHNAIRVKTERRRDWQTAFKIRDADGELISAGKSKG